MTGKEKCAYLKRLREKIARKYGLSGFEFTECSFQGECAGTCPACESDLERLSSSVSSFKANKSIPGSAPVLKPTHGVTGRSGSEITGKVTREATSRYVPVPPKSAGVVEVQGGIRPAQFDGVTLTPAKSNEDSSGKSAGSYLPVFGIVRHRIDLDGPGVVTLVGVQGCSLSCKYCINAITPDAVLYDMKTLFSVLSLDSVYFEESGGGVCFGGHEPLLNADFILRFIQFVKSKGLNWKFSLETSLNVSKYPRELFQLVDHIVVDVKSVDPTVYASYTGGTSNDLVLESLRRIASDPLVCSKVRLRVPLIPGFNDFRDVGRAVGFLTGTLGFPLGSIEMFEYTRNC